MEIYHLEEHMKDAASLSGIAGVYWSARDMDPFPLGNHHFFTFIYESEEQAQKFANDWKIEYFSEENDKNLIVYYTTMGVDKNDEGKIIIRFNPKSDKKSIHEIAKEENTNVLSYDRDFEGHRIPYDLIPPSCTSNEKLMTAILTKVFIFNTHLEGGDGVYYFLWDENCACMVNSILRVLGYPRKVRDELGEFWGVDWGEEDVIQGDYFEEPMYYVGNSHTKEFHNQHCKWRNHIKEEHKVIFVTSEEPIKKGYNGCHYCLDRWDTE